MGGGVRNRKTTKTETHTHRKNLYFLCCCHLRWSCADGGWPLTKELQTTFVVDECEVFPFVCLVLFAYHGNRVRAVRCAHLYLSNNDEFGDLWEAKNLKSTLLSILLYVCLHACYLEVRVHH